MTIYFRKKKLYDIHTSPSHKYVSKLFPEICVKLYIFNGILIELFNRYNTVLYRIYFSGHPVYIISVV